MRDDDPGDLVHDLFAEALFGDHPLGRPVIGTVETIETLTRDQIAGFYRRRYRPENMVVAAAGASTTPTWSGWCAGAFGGRLDPAGDAAAAARRRPGPGRRAGRARSSVAGPADRAGPPRARRHRRWPATTSAASPSACSTARSAAG